MWNKNISLFVKDIKILKGVNNYEYRHNVSDSSVNFCSRKRIIACFLFIECPDF